MARVVLLMLLVAPVTAHARPGGHVRSVDPLIDALIERGAARSVTIRSLIDILDHSDLIVYIEQRVARDTLGAYLPHRLVARGGVRYVTLVIGEGSERWQLRAIAHELQHAVEIARAPEVQRSQDMEGLFKRIGFLGACSRGCYETREAIAIERRAGQELRSSTAWRKPVDGDD
jgi:hypothetical protein